MTSLKKILPDSVPEAVEKAFLDKLYFKMFSGANYLVIAVRAIQAKYGSEGIEAIHRAIIESAVKRGSKMASDSDDHSPRALCSIIEGICAGSHEWLKLEDSDNRQAYRFTRCMWAEAFKALEAEDIGFWICEGDGPMASAFNPAIGFCRTKTLMMGDDCCDHIYYMKE